MAVFGILETFAKWNKEVLAHSTITCFQIHISDPCISLNMSFDPCRCHMVFRFQSSERASFGRCTQTACTVLITL